MVVGSVGVAERSQPAVSIASGIERVSGGAEDSQRLRDTSARLTSSFCLRSEMLHFRIDAAPPSGCSCPPFAWTETKARKEDRRGPLSVSLLRIAGR